MSDLQHETDIEQTKAKLREIEDTKEGRKDPRQATTLIQRRQERGERVPEEEREIQAGKTKPKRKRFSQKLKEAMFSEDIGNGSVTEHIFFKILIPSTKRVLSDMANTAINMALGLDPKTRTIGAGSTHTANASLYRNRQSENRAEYYSRKGILDDYEWDEATAKEYFNRILDHADQYGDISIRGVKSIVGLGHLIRTTDNKWGWTMSTLTRADVIPVDATNENWVILLPEPRPL